MLSDVAVKDIHQVKENEWGTECLYWMLLDDPAFSVLQEKMPSNTADELHYHHTVTQFLYVLTGVLQIELDEKMFILKPHQGLKIPKGMLHRVINNSDNDTHFLLISSPGGIEDRVSKA